jgi:DNA-binding CsgD family transcriptional regulator
MIFVRLFRIRSRRGAAEQIYAFAEAEGHFLRALELWDLVDDPADLVDVDRTTLLERAAEATNQVGDGTRAVSLLERALDSLDESQTFRAGLLRARLGPLLLWVVGDGKAAVREQRRAVEILSGHPASGAHARVLVELGLTEAICGSVDAAVERAEEALAMARSLEARAEESMALQTLSVATRIGINTDDPLRSVALSEEALQIAEEIGDPVDLGRAFMMHSESLGVGGRIDEAIATAKRGAGVMQRLGLERTHGSFLLLNAAQFSMARDRWREASRLVEQALSKSSHSFTRFYALALQAHVEIRKGNLKQARHSLDEARGHLEGAAWIQVIDSFHAADADLAVWEHRLDDARAVVAQSALTVVRRDPYYAAPLCSIGLRAEADRATSARARRQHAEVEAAVGVGAHLLEQARENERAPAPEAAAHAAVSRAEFSRLEGVSDPDLWAEAARDWKDLACAYWASYAQWREAEALLVARSAPRRAAEVLRTAHEESLRLGAALLNGEIEVLARRARIDLKRTTQVEESPSRADVLGLTPREVEVLGLLTAGRTNRQIAEALFISHKTAAAHVSNILAKLGAAGRVEAAGIAVQEGLVDSHENN